MPFKCFPGSRSLDTIGLIFFLNQLVVDVCISGGVHTRQVEFTELVDLI